MLRHVLSKLQSSSQSLNLVRAASTAPSVYDKLVQITVLDKQGRRHVLRGYEGQTVVDVLMANNNTLGDDAVTLSPEGRGVWEAHVKVPTELHDRIPAPVGDERDELEDIAEGNDLDVHSRLASKITLARDLDGLLVALGALRPWKSL